MCMHETPDLHGPMQIPIVLPHVHPQLSIDAESTFVFLESEAKQ